MPSPILYPLLNGVRHAFASVELKLVTGQVFTGFKSLNYKRTRTRALLRANHPDPQGKTIGENEYTCDAEFALAEFNQLQALLQAQGVGYGDQFFPIIATYSAVGMDTIVDTIVGCTLDESDASQSQGPDPLFRKCTFNPLKIYFNGLDDLAQPLIAPQQ